MEGFRCYQAALRAAGYTPNPEIAAAEKRRRFGLPLPSIGHKAPARPPSRIAEGDPGAAAVSSPSAETSDNNVNVVLEQVAVIPPLNRLLLVTKDGAVWLQTDSEIVAPLPKPGQTMTVSKGSISGFFCEFDRRNKVRCVRTH